MGWTNTHLYEIRARRRIEVPFDIRLDRLHLVIRIAQIAEARKLARDWNPKPKPKPER
jgi:hypothetical protein